MTHLYASELHSVARELRTADELHVLAHLLHDVVLFLLGGSLHALSQGLFGEAFLIDAVYSVAYIEEILNHQQCILGQEREEGHLFFHTSQFGHDGDLLQTVFRQLGLYLEGTYGVDVVAKEVNTER